MNLYGDTSALAKLFLQEVGSAEMRSAVGAAERVVSIGIA